MVQGDNESLEYYEKIFQLSYKRYHIYSLDDEYLKLVLLRGVKEDLIDTLKPLKNCDIFYMKYENIK
jgi:hypothetical protein